MTNASTEIQLLVDRSGSMVNIRTDMEGAINTYLADQAQQSGECRVSIAQFDSDYDVVTVAKPIAEVPAFVLRPRGSTALYDAMARAINDLGQRLAAMAEDQRPGQVLFVIVTDGEENSSHEYDAARVRALVEHQEQVYSWNFVYVGANQDAYGVANSVGISADNSMNYGANQVGTSTFSSNLSGYTTRYRTEGTRGFTAAEQIAGENSTKVQ